MGIFHEKPTIQRAGGTFQEPPVFRGEIAMEFSRAGPLFQFLQIFGIFLVSEADAAMAPFWLQETPCHGFGFPAEFPFNSVGFRLLFFEGSDS